MATNGNDLIYATAASQNINGMGGTDTVFYGRLAGNVALDIASDASLYVYKSNGSYDTLTNVEVISATDTGGDSIFAFGSNYSINVDLQRASLRINTPVAKNLTVTHFDNVWGSGLSDRITGNNGNNFIKGGGGADILTGGAGYDIFSYDFRSDSTGSQVDTITDFASGWDKIDLRCFDADPRIAGRQSLRWKGGFGLSASTIRPGEVGLDGGNLIAHVEGGVFRINITNPNPVFAFRNPVITDLLL